VSDAQDSVTLAAAPPSGSNRYDVVTVLPRTADGGGGAQNDWIFNVIQGAALASPVVPAVPAGQVAIATVYVPGASAAITAGNVTDSRPYGMAIDGHARGFVARVSGPSASKVYGTASLTEIYRITVNLKGNRKYRVTVNAMANTAGANSSRNYIQLDGVDYPAWRPVNANNVISNTAWAGGSSELLTPAADGPVTLILSAFGDVSGTVNVNACSIAVEDVGPATPSTPSLADLAVEPSAVLDVQDGPDIEPDAIAEGA
jgi:hypothetical protein